MLYIINFLFVTYKRLPPYLSITSLLWKVCPCLSFSYYIFDSYINISDSAHGLLQKLYIIFSSLGHEKIRLYNIVT